MEDGYFCDPSQKMNDISRFLASVPSRGPKEKRARGMLFKHYDSADIDVLFLSTIAKKLDICVPKYYLCANIDTGLPIYTSTQKSRCKANAAVLAGALILNTRSRDPLLVIPDKLIETIRRCKKRFVIVNLGVYLGNDLYTGHANSLIFDNVLHSIERYDPLGSESKYEQSLKSKFKSYFPGWTYTASAPVHRGPQRNADAYGGMCVTYSLWYSLLRVLNPDLTSKKLHSHMMSHNPLDTVLRLNRFVIDTLRKTPDA